MVSVTENDGRNPAYTFARYSQSSLNSYKKKKIDSVTFHFYRCDVDASGNSDNVIREGGTVAALKNAFAMGINYVPESLVFNFGYTELSNKKNDADVRLVTNYYESGADGTFGGKLYRSFYDQMAIGFLFENNVPPNQRKEIHWGCWTLEETHTIDFRLSDFDTISAFSPIENIFIDALKPNTFMVSFDAFDSIEHPTVTKATVEIMDLATSAVITVEYNLSINLKGISSVNINIPANTVAKNKNYQWRAKLTTNDGETNFSEWANFTTSDAIPNAPIIKSPQSSYLDAASPITLSWTHDIDTGSTQYAYDVDYKQSGGWISFKSHVVSASNTDIIPANTLEAGSFVWRVRTYNTDNVSGAYAESATNIVQARPQTPIIMSISTLPKMVIAWQSSGQQAYELTIGTEKIYQFGIDKSFTYPGYLPDGSYAIALRVQNSQGLWSEYATANVSVKNVPISGEDIITATTVSGGVRIDLGLPDVQDAVYLNECYVGEFYTVHEPQAATGERYLLRNDVPIAKIDGTSYIDYESAGLSGYVLRVVSGGNYYDSPEVYAAPRIKYGVMAAADNPSDFIPLAYRIDSKPQPQKQLTKGYNQHYFSGRAQPVYDITEHYQTTWPLEYSMRRGDYAKLDAWAKTGKSLLIRYNDGTVIRGIAQGTNITKVLRDVLIVSLTVVVHDYTEAIDYV
nr:MAG TPA: Interferon alpha/beta receptor 1, Interferon I interferon signaling complex [Caudoviricetes sp.]